MLALLSRAGHRLGQRRLAQRRQREPGKGAGAAEAAVFGLMGLLIAFTFSGAAERFEARRHLVTQEVNAIGTAWLRLDLLPASSPAGPARTVPPLYSATQHGTYLHGERYLASQQQQLAAANRLQSQHLANAALACQPASTVPPLRPPCCCYQH